MIQIDILNSTYSTTRFAFTYAWWSAFGFSRHVKKDAVAAEEMKLIDQEQVQHPECLVVCIYREMSTIMRKPINSRLFYY